LASKATEGSLMRSYGPAGVAKTVVPGRKPGVPQLPPLLVEVAKPMSQLPPSETRPTWKAATMVAVAAFENVSGSTSVWWLVVAEALQVVCVKGSLLICTAEAA